ncbi:MAG: AsmA family protein, partial [Proteobacteria bacterium]|nr:AsmA family protein [Pseudomonadota bacterium]
MKIVGRTIKIVLLLIVLIFVALLAFVATFDANNYKPQIIEQVENATGRDFAINGDINLSIFPWVGIKIEEVVLGNDKGFKGKHFAAIKQLDVKVNVLPLLKKEVEINVIRLHGLDVSLEVAKNKSNNWTNFSAPASTSETAAEAGSEARSTAPKEQPAVESETDTAGADTPLRSLKIEGFEFVDAIIRYDDRSSNMKATVSELNLQTSAITFDEPIEVKFSTRIESNQPVIDTRLTMSTQLTFDKDFTEIDLSEFVFTIIADASEFLPQPETIEIKSDINVLLEEKRVSIKQLQLSALGTNTIANITIAQYSDNPVIQGSIEVHPFNARQVAKRVAVELPEMARADALNKVAIKTKIKLHGEKFQANDFSLTLDDSTLSGWIHLLNITKQQLRYDLTFDRLNLNDYMPPVTEPVVSAGTGSAREGASAEAVAVADTSTGDEQIELPLEMMRTLDMQGDFRITALTAKEYQIKQFLLSTRAQKGIIDIKPLSMQVLQGQVTSDVQLNVKKDIPAYAIKLDVNQIQV